MERFISVKEATKISGFSKHRLYQLFKRGKIRCFKPTGPHGHIRIKESDLINFMQSGQNIIVRKNDEEGRQLER